MYTFVWQDERGSYPIGYVVDRVIGELGKVPADIRGPLHVDRTCRTISLFQLPTEPERSALVANLVSYWRQHETFDLLKGWRDELWPVFSRDGEVLFSIERAAMGLLGTVRYGVHLTAFVTAPSAPYGLLIWVPKRAASKSTFPGMLDNTVAGGLTTGEQPLECIIREAEEEASLPEKLVREKAKNVGTVTYAYITEKETAGDSGFIYPECQWVYDLNLPHDVVPHPKDGEVERFDLCDVNQVKRDLADGKFKNNCAVVMLDFLIRHKIITASNEPHFHTICRRMHRKLPFPGPHHAGWCSPWVA